MDGDEVRARWAHGAARAAAAGRHGRDDLPVLPGDVLTFMGAPVAVGPMDLVGADVAVLGIPYQGAPAGAVQSPPSQDEPGGPTGGGADEGPAAVRRHSTAYALGQGSAFMPEPGSRPFALDRLRLVDYGDVAAESGDVGKTFVRAHEKLADVFAAGAVPIVLGGDHAITVPVLQVLAGKLAGKLGLVAFDARFDLGSRPRYAAGSQWAAAFELGILEPANFVQIGINGAGEPLVHRCVADELGHRYYTMAEVDEAGAATVAQEALELAASGTEAVYVSLDVAAVDPAAAGLPQADPGGLAPRELLHALRVLSGGPVAGFDICSVVPRLDPQGRLCRLAARAALEVIAGLARQRP